MEFFAQNYQLGTLLNKKIYKIPEFQREYSWEKEELEAFWEDIISDKDNNNFFGTIVLVGENFNDKIGPFEIIDGQQRMTTFLLLINRIISKFRNIEEKDLADALEERLIFKDDNAVKHLSLENDNAHSFFQKILFYNTDPDDLSVESKKLLFAKLFFENLLGLFNKEKLISLRDYVLKINIIVVVQTDHDKAFEIFETLNFRGMDLSVLDLVKNFIVRNYPKQIGIDDPRETWKSILQNTKDDKKNFFNRYWATRFKKVSEPKLYYEFKNTTKEYSSEKTRELLFDLKSFSDIYRDVMTPSNTSWIRYCPHDRKEAILLKFSIDSLSRFQVKVHYSILITVLELSKNNKINKNQIMSLVNILDKFHFIFNAICSKRPSGMDQRYSSYSIRLQKNPEKFDDIICDLKKELIEKLPDREEFIQNFVKINFEDNKNLILYSFRILEKKLEPGKDVDLTEESLDHLSTQDEGLEWCHNVGNLILLEKEFNQERDNKKLEDSLGIINKTSFKTTKLFLQENFISWTQEMAKDRAIKIGGELYDYIISKYFKKND
ncbi:MAG: DUF262 domain-containing protein [Candidatus Paceibacterota bacterium]